MDNRKFFIIEKYKSEYSERYTIHSDKMYDLTTAMRKMLALDTLNEDRKQTSYYLQQVDLSIVETPLVADEVKEDKNWKDCVDESLPS
tara:strand:- start:201 stop:464 length:264 start_codon:yes stop_codon:yes gene_type:complete